MSGSISSRQMAPNCEEKAGTLVTDTGVLHQVNLIPKKCLLNIRRALRNSADSEVLLDIA